MREHVLLGAELDFRLRTPLVENLVNDGVAMLQYADDKFFMFEDSLDSVVNLKLILCIFEHLSGLKINIHKSEIFLFGEARDKGVEYKKIFTSVEGFLPLKHLGVPVHSKKLRNSDWKSPRGESREKGRCLERQINGLWE